MLFNTRPDLERKVTELELELEFFKSTADDDELRRHRFGMGPDVGAAPRR